MAGAWTLEWDAVDPTTGASVAGVKVSSANVVGSDQSVTTPPKDEQSGPFMLVPGPDA